MTTSLQPRKLGRFCREIALLPNQAAVAYHAFYRVYNRGAVKDCAKKGERARRTLSLRVRQRTRWTLDLRELSSVELERRSRRTGRARGAAAAAAAALIPAPPSFLPSFPPGSGQQEGQKGGKQTELTCALPFEGFIVYPLVSRDDCRAIVLERHPSEREKTRGTTRLKVTFRDRGKGREITHLKVTSPFGMGEGKAKNTLNSHGP